MVATLMSVELLYFIEQKAKTWQIETVFVKWYSSAAGELGTVSRCESNWIPSMGISFVFLPG